MFFISTNFNGLSAEFFDRIERNLPKLPGALEVLIHERTIQEEEATAKHFYWSLSGTIHSLKVQEQ